MDDKRPLLPRCDPSDGKHRRGCPLFRHPSWGDTDGVCNCSMLYECRTHDRDLSVCRDEAAEALRAAAERVKEAARVLLVERQEVGLGSRAAAYGITQMRNRALAAIEEA